MQDSIAVPTAAPLSGGKVALRRLTSLDASALHCISGDPRVMRYWYPGPDADVQATAQRIAAIEAHWQTHGFGDWAVVDRTDGRLIGFAGLHHLDRMAEVNLGYALAPSRWRRGIGTDLCRFLLAHAFTRLGLPEVVAVIHPRNEASIALARRCGLSVAGEVCWQGQERVVYSLGAAEWKQWGVALR